jgi:hypothetical protein
MPSRSDNAGWREIAGRRHYFRSKWEFNYGAYLQWQKEKSYIKEWQHEPKTFWYEGIKRGTNNYKPDFRVDLLDGSHYWVEVKGYMDAKSQTKIKRFKSYFPDEEIRVIDKSWFKKNNEKMRIIVKGWE